MAMPRSILFIAALLAVITPLRADVTHVDNVALERLLRRGVPVIDIRTPEEWRDTGMIEGSHLLTFFDAQGRYDSVRGYRSSPPLPLPTNPSRSSATAAGAATWSASFWTGGSATGVSTTCPEGSRSG